MVSTYPVEMRRQVVELARSGTRVGQLAETFGMSEAVIHGWLKQKRIDRGEAPGLSTEGQMEVAATKRRMRQLETDPAVSRKVNEVFLEQNPQGLGRHLRDAACDRRAQIRRHPSRQGPGAFAHKTPGNLQWTTFRPAQMDQYSGGAYNSHHQPPEQLRVLQLSPGSVPGRGTPRLLEVRGRCPRSLGSPWAAAEPGTTLVDNPLRVAGKRPI
jgi:transposase